MISPLPLETVRINPGSVDAWLEIVAWVTVATILAGLWVLRSYLRYRSLDAEARRHMRTIRPQLLRGTSVSIRIKRGFERLDARDRIRGGFDRSDSIEDDDATARDVARGLSSAAASARPSWVPLLAWRGILEGGLLLVAGLVAFAPMALWEWLVDPSPGVDAESGTAAASTALDVVLGALSAFPYSDLVADLAIASGILALSGLWGAWLLPAILLVGGGIVLSILSRRIREWGSVPDDVAIVPSRTRTGVRLVVWGVGLWFVGALVATVSGVIGAAIGPRGELVAALGEFFALLVVLSLAISGLGLFIWDSWRRTARIAETHAAETASVLVYLIVRRVYLALAIVGAALVVSYLGFAIATARITEVGAIVLGAPLWLLAILVLAAASLVVIAALRIPDVVDDLRDLGARISRSAALRLWIFSRGVPIVGTISAFGLVAAMSGSLLAGIVAAVVVGVILRVVGAILVRAKYAALSRYSGLKRPVKEIHVSPYKVEDDDAGTLHVVEIDGKRLVHRDRDALLEDVLDVVRERSESGEWLSTESEHYADRVVDGYVDLDRLRTKLRAETRLETLSTIREHGGELDRNAARDAISRDYPEEVVEDAVVELRRRGDLDLRSGRLVVRS